MIKCIVTKGFTLHEFDKLKNLKRSGARNEKGRLYVNDTFECSKKMADYLTGNNKDKEVVVSIKEIEPEYKEVKLTTVKSKKPFVEAKKKK